MFHSALRLSNEWVGKELVIGNEVKLRVTGPCPRCIMTTLAQADLPKDPGILKTVAQYNERHIGVYASVIESGTIPQGDGVRIKS